MPESEYEKKDTVYSVRISPSLKAEIELLPETFKHKLTEEMRLKIKEVIHASKFNPNLYP